MIDSFRTVLAETRSKLHLTRSTLEKAMLLQLLSDTVTTEISSISREDCLERERCWSLTFDNSVREMGVTAEKFKN